MIDPSLPKGLHDSHLSACGMIQTCDGLRLVRQIRGLVVLVFHGASESNVRNEQDDPDKSAVEGNLSCKV